MSRARAVACDDVVGPGAFARRIVVEQDGFVVATGFSSMVLADNVARLIEGEPLVMCGSCGERPATHSGAGAVVGAFCPRCRVGGA